MIVLFFVKTKLTHTKQKHASDKKQEVRVLDVQRSNAINIGLTVLPPPRTIKSAIIAMDEKALTKEQVEVSFLYLFQCMQQLISKVIQL